MNVGDIVLYRATVDDVQRASKLTEGNHVHEGQLYPLVVVVVWPDEYGPGVPGVNGQVILDGPHSLWVTSVQRGTRPGTWQEKS